MALQAKVIAGLSKRDEFPLVPKKSALVVIDIQRYLSEEPSEGEGDASKESHYLYNQALPSAIDKINDLVTAFRSIRDDSNASGGCEVIFCYLQSATNNGRDISLDYKLSGPKLTNIPTLSTPENELFLEKLKPNTIDGKGDILLPKTSRSVFVSTNLDYMLRNLGIEQIVLTGQLTDQCVESAVRDAADLNYFVTLAEDACAATSRENHDKGLHGAKGFARIVSTQQVLNELAQATGKDAKSESKPDRGFSKEPTDANVLEYLKSRGLDSAVQEVQQYVQDPKRQKIA